MAVVAVKAAGLSSRFQIYRELSKSGIVALVLISVFGGYLIGHPFERPFEPLRLALTLIAILLLASGSSAMNQIQEWKIDAKMPRTSKRPLPSGRMSMREALIFSIGSMVVGLILLSQLSWGLVGLGAAAVVSYNGLYTLWWKKHWAFAAVPGAVPGALPILMGYAAASGEIFSSEGIFLFGILFFWQMPHFWVLALRYKGDYEAGGVPTLPVAHGSGITVSQIVIWCLAYVALALLGTIFLRTGSIYFVSCLVVSAILLWELRGFAREPETKKWLRFFLWVNFSLILYILAAAVDLWSVYLVPYFKA